MRDFAQSAVAHTVLQSRVKNLCWRLQRLTTAERMRTYLTLVGLLSICSFSFSQGNTSTTKLYLEDVLDCIHVFVNVDVFPLTFTSECRRDLLENVDFPGSDIKFVYSPDTEHCQKLCTQHSACLFFTFIRADWTKDKRYETSKTVFFANT